MRFILIQRIGLIWDVGINLPSLGMECCFQLISYFGVGIYQILGFSGILLQVIKLVSVVLKIVVQLPLALPDNRSRSGSEKRIPTPIFLGIIPLEVDRKMPFERPFGHLLLGKQG